MKRWIHAAENTNKLTIDYILELLSEQDIDTTLQSYEVTYDDGDRYEGEDIRSNRFNCNGDWLACFSIFFKKAPTIDIMCDYYTKQEFRDFVMDHPTINSVVDEFSSYEEAAQKLKNLDTNITLYENEYL